MISEMISKKAAEFAERKETAAAAPGKKNRKSEPKPKNSKPLFRKPLCNVSDRSNEIKRVLV